MNKTPFDDIAVNIFHSIHQLQETDEKLSICLSFVNVCRVKYIQMYNSSLKFWNIIDEALAVIKEGQPGATPTRGSISNREMIEKYSDSKEAITNYFSFIEELNRFGRVFERKYKSILPDYYRLKFYRNKMIEHWDEYEKFLQQMGKSCLLSLL